jgi:hypothetical protein
MDRDARDPDRSDQTLQEDSGMIGSETEEPGPGRDTSLTDPDPVSASTDQPRGTVAMSEGDPMRTRLGSQVEGAGVIGYDVAAAEEGATQQTPAEERPGYEPERPAGEAPVPATAPVAYDREPELATPAAYEREPELAEPAVYEREPGWSGSATDDALGRSAFDEAPGRDAPATYTGEEADVAGRPEYAERAEGSDQPLYQQEPQRADRPGGGGSLFTDEEPERLDRPGPQEPGVDQGVYDQEADQARRQRPSDGI